MAATIHKAAGIIIKDKKLLVTRSKGKDIFVAPGGKLEPGETTKQAAVRELQEELQIEVDEENLEVFGEFSAEAAGQPGVTVSMTVFMVDTYSGEPQPASEIEEMKWVDSTTARTLSIGSIFAHEVIPRLQKSELIE